MVADTASGADLSVNEMLLAYVHHADTYYVKNRKPTMEPVNIGLALRPLRQLYGHTLAGEFGPLGLKTVRLSVSLLSIPTGEPLGSERDGRGLRISTRSARRGFHSAELAGLLAVEREPGCKLAVSVLDLPEPEAGPKRRPLYGPIPWSWWLPASRLPGKSLQVASVCWLLAGWGQSADFELVLGRSGRVRPLPVLGLPAPGRLGTGRVGVSGPTRRPTQRGNDSGSVKRFATICVNRQL
jgi:hypothetical protein